MNAIFRNMKKPEIHRFWVRGENHSQQLKRFVAFTEYERLEAKYKELWDSYRKLEKRYDEFVTSF
jgi:hypothetical protein